MTNLKNNRDFLIAALDFGSAEKALYWVDALGDSVSFYKVGMQLFFTEGKFILEKLQQRGKKIFLDLKLNDIPNTVKEAVNVIADYQVDYLSLFCGADAVSEAAGLLSKRKSALKLLKITKLTSDPASGEADKSYVVRIAEEACQAGAHGIVCSGHETSAVRQALEKKSRSDFLIINPGIRLASHSLDDQQRVVTPREARDCGANHIVVGRPIFKSDNPLSSVSQIFESLA